MVICLKRGADCLHMVQLMPLPSQTPSSLVPFKSRLVLPFWYRLTQVALEKRPLNGTCVYSFIHYVLSQLSSKSLSQAASVTVADAYKDITNDRTSETSTHSCCCTDGLAITVHDECSLHDELASDETTQSH